MVREDRVGLRVANKESSSSMDYEWHSLLFTSSSYYTNILYINVNIIAVFYILY